MPEENLPAGPGTQERLASVGLLLGVAAAPLLPSGFAIAAGVLGIVIGWALLRKDVVSVATGVFFALFFAGVALRLGPSQLTLAIATAGYGVLVWLRPEFRSAASWVRKGRFDKSVVVISAGSVLLAGTALVVWFCLFKPNLEDILKNFVPDLSLPLLISGGILFAMVNAALEEIAYRGVLMDGLQMGTGSVAFALVGQAVAFGTLHIHGFPRGPIGVCLATIYGLMMGALRIRSRGMLAPWLAHVMTDVIIITIVLFLAR